MIPRSLWVITQTELRLLTRQIGFKLYIALVGILAIVIVLNTDHNSNSLDSLVWVVNNLTFFQFPLIALVVAYHATKNNRQVGEWLWATPLELPLFILGQLLALLIGFAIVTVIILMVACFLLVFQGIIPFNLLLSLWFYGLLLLLPITFAEIGIALTVSLWVRRALLAVLIISGVVTLLWLGVLMPTATLLTPLNYTLLTLRLDPIAIFGAEDHLLVPLLSFYMLLPLPFLILSFWIVPWLDQRTKWKPNHKFPLSVFFLIAVLATSLAFSFYSDSVQHSTVPPPVNEQIDNWTVTTALFSGSITNTVLEMTGQLSLLNQSQQTHSSIILGFNPGLEIVYATINKQPTKVEREGESIRLTSSDLRVNPGEMVEIEFNYRGTPYLLREDYALVRNIDFDGHNPTSFRQPIRGYVDSQTIFLARDGDWLVWPRVSFPHLAIETTELQLTIYSDLPIISSGTMLNSDSRGTTYQWLNPPQLLLVSGPYNIHQEANDSIWIAPLNHRYDAVRGSSALILRRVLAGWLEDSGPEQSYEVVILPYALEVVTGGSIIGLPATGQELIRQGSTHQSDEWSVRELASTISTAWLKDAMSWEGNTLNFDGQLRSSTTICGPPDENGHQECVTYGLGSINPQSPEGRLTESTNNSLLLNSLSIVLAQQITLQVTDDQSFFENEHQLWTTVTAHNESPLELLGEENALHILSRHGLLPRHMTDEERHDLAHLVLTISCLHSELGNDGFRQLMQSLTANYPIGSTPITEDIFWDIAGLFTINLEAIRAGTHTPCQMGDIHEHHH